VVTGHSHQILLLRKLSFVLSLHIDEGQTDRYSWQRNSADEGALEPWLTVAAKDMFTVVACAGIGAFIDFYIGKSGQRRVKDCLETWWLKFSDVRWGALGREEALFAVQILNLLFGDRLFSARRMIVVSVWVFLGSLTIITVYRLGELYDLHLLSPYVWIAYFFLFCLATLSVSITTFASAKVAILLTKAPYLNIVGLIFILLFQYSLIVFWYPAMETVRTDIIVGFTETNVFGFLTHFS
jgi:hypothetical protein